MKNIFNTLLLTILLAGCSSSNISKPLAIKDSSTGKSFYKLASDQWYKHNYPQALKLYKKAANNNYHIANSDIGRIYEKGLGTKKNYTLASKYYLKGAKKGIRSAQYYIGQMYLNGKGIERNYNEALRWFAMSAAKNDGHSYEAENAIGHMYANGLGVNKDLNKAKYWFKRSFANGSHIAKENLQILESNN